MSPDKLGCHMRMLKAMSVIVICGAAPLSALSQSTSQHSEARSSNSAVAPQLQTPTKSTEVIGFDDVNDKTVGILTIEDGMLRFVHSGIKSQIPVEAIEDVVTADDSQRVIQGTMGKAAMFALSEAGRSLSMFRSKVDYLTIEYRDEDGGLHGAIFTMPPGTTESFKRALIAQGAHTTILSPTNADVDSSHQVAATEKQ